MATHKNVFRRRRNKIRRIEARDARYRGERNPVSGRRPSAIGHSGFKALLPEWWPCLCNGGWDTCPVCGCGLASEPPCTLCASEPPDVGDPLYSEWRARLEKQPEQAARRAAGDALVDPYAAAAWAADLRENWETRKWAMDDADAFDDLARDWGRAA